MRRAATSSRAEAPFIRPARSDEREDLVALMRRASLALPDYRADLEANPEAVDLPQAQLDAGDVIVAEIGGKRSGFAAIVEGELDALFVEPDQWRRGIGRALVEEAAHLARRRGLSLTVVANPSARKFYESCGFSREGEVATRFGPALRMSR